MVHNANSLTWDQLLEIWECKNAPKMVYLLPNVFLQPYRSFKKSTRNLRGINYQMEHMWWAPHKHKNSLRLQWGSQLHCTLYRSFIPTLPVCSASRLRQSEKFINITERLTHRVTSGLPVKAKKTELKAGGNKLWCPAFKVPLEPSLTLMVSELGMVSSKKVSLSHSMPVCILH